MGEVFRRTEYLEFSYGIGSKKGYRNRQLTLPRQRLKFDISPYVLVRQNVQKHAFWAFLGLKPDILSVFSDFPSLFEKRENQPNCS